MGNGICFAQQYYDQDAGTVRTGAIIGYKSVGNGSFGGGLQFKVQQSGANPLKVALKMDHQGHLYMPHDNQSLKIGASQDLQINHDATHSRIHNNTGALLLETDNSSIQLNKGTSENMLVATIDGSVELYYDNSKKLETFSGGISVTGQVNSDGSHMGDNDKALFGNSNDLEIYHDGNHSRIKDTGTGDLVLHSNAISFMNAADSEQIARFHQDGSNELYYDNSKKLETTSSGGLVTGQLLASSGFKVNDGVHITLGTDNDFKLYHDGSNAAWLNTTGNNYLYGSGGNFFIRPVNGEGSIDAIANGAVNLYYDNSKKFETTSTGIKTTGNVAANETIVQVLHANETQGVGTGFNGLHMIGSNTNVEMSLRSKGTGVVKLQSSANEDMAIFTPNGAVELYYDNDKKLETTSDGVDVTGELDVAGDFKTSTARGYTLDIQDGVNGSRTSVTLTFVTGSNGRTAFVEMFVGTANYHLHHVSHRYYTGGLNVLTNDGTGCTVSSSVSGAGNSNIT